MKKKIDEIKLGATLMSERWRETVERLRISGAGTDEQYPYADWIRVFSETRSGIARKQKQDETLGRMMRKRGGENRTLAASVHKICPDAIFKLEVVNKELNEALNAA